MSTKRKKNVRVPDTIGLTIGSDAVGYAVTDQKDVLLKYNGEPMWGTTMFEAASQKDERRMFRTERRRLDRSQQRVLLTQEIFAEEVKKVDERFFLRIKEGGLWREDTTTKSTYHLFEEEKAPRGELPAHYNDRIFHQQYPTIHHLIMDLIQGKEKKDIRLIYLAVEWLMKHRGHFLNETDKTNVKKVLNFDEVYEGFEICCEEYYGEKLWECNPQDFANTIMSKIAVAEKERAFAQLLNDGKKFKTEKTDIVSKAAVIKLLSGGKIKPGKLFPVRSLKEMESISLEMEESEFMNIVNELDEDGQLLLLLREMYNWALLKETLNGQEHISAAKVECYEQHKTDLAYLKAFVKKYVPEKYYLIFREEGLGNYVAYSGHGETPRCTQEVFCSFLQKVLSDIEVEPEEHFAYQEMMKRIAEESFMPRQRGRESRIIPYQLYWQELYLILEAAQKHYPFLTQTDEDGYQPINKLLSVFTFCVPYYIGPLRVDESSFAWMKRKAEGKIMPWNYKEKIDLEETEKAFIDRMTNQCSYLPEEEVLPKSSILYTEFLALEEINEKISEENLVLSQEEKEALVYQIQGKKNKALYKLCNMVSEDDAENIIRYFTYVQEKQRKKEWLNTHYPQLNEEEKRQILRFSFHEFSRVSRRFLTEIKGVSKETGEVLTVMDAMRKTNDTLHVLLSDRYTFAEVIEKIRKEYYQGHAESVDSILEKMYVTNSMRRPIYRALAILSDIITATKCAPKRICFSMTESFREKEHYIYLQLSATKKAPKAFKTILEILYPETEIIYVEPGKISAFRKENNLIRTRSINEFYHGKDAYLSTICGTLRNSSLTEEKTEQVRKVLAKNNLHHTRFLFERKGGLFDQMPLKKGQGLVPRKANLPISKYGGYNRPTVTFFLLVKYRARKHPDMMFMPVDLYASEQVMKNKTNAIAYARKNIAAILKKEESKIEMIEFPLGLRAFKINTVISVDGYRMVLCGSASGKRQLMVSSMEPLILPEEMEAYVKRLEKFIKRREEKGIERVDRWEDGIDGARNMELYNALTLKMGNPKYFEQFGPNLDYLEKSREDFKRLRLDEQIDVLMNMIRIFKTGRTVGCDLSKVGGRKNSANRPLAANLSNWRKRFRDVRIIDTSPSGIFEKTSVNLLKMF